MHFDFSQHSNFYCFLEYLAFSNRIAYSLNLSVNHFTDVLYNYLFTLFMTTFSILKFLEKKVLRFYVSHDNAKIYKLI